MARNLRLKTNVQSPDSDYLYGRIKDDDGSGNGTPVNEEVYGDFHQFFARLFAKSGYTYNGQPDNAYSGFQFYDALIKVCKNYTGVTKTSTGITLTNMNVGKLINTEGATGAVFHILPDSVTANDGDKFTFFNNGQYSIGINCVGTDTVNTIGGGFILNKQFDFVELVLDKANKNWALANFKVTQNIDPITIGSGGGAPAFQNSWSAASPITYRMNNDNFVSLDGIAQKSTTSSGVMFTLPTEVRPLVATYVASVLDKGTGPEPCLVLIATNGNVTITPTPSATTINVFLTNINYYKS